MSLLLFLKLTENSNYITKYKIQGDRVVWLFLNCLQYSFLWITNVFKFRHKPFRVLEIVVLCIRKCSQHLFVLCDTCCIAFMFDALKIYNFVNILVAHAFIEKIEM